MTLASFMRARLARLGPVYLVCSLVCLPLVFLGHGAINPLLQGGYALHIAIVETFTVI